MPCLPFPARADMMVGAEQMVLSLPRLYQSELCWTKRLLRAFGIVLVQTFSRRSTHLLCPSACGAKYDKTKEWNVPLMGMAWLEDMAKEGRVLHVGEYLIGDIGERAAKGETKEDVQMVDNSRRVGNPSHSLFTKKQNLLQDIRTPAAFEIGHAPPSTFFAKPNSLLDDALPDPEDDDNVPSFVATSDHIVVLSLAVSHARL